MPMTHGSNVIRLPACRYADGAVPSRADDEQLLRIVDGLEARGRVVTFEPVSPYLERPLRSEAEVRAKRIIIDVVRP